MKIRTKLKGGALVSDAVGTVAQTLNLDQMGKRYTQQTGKSCGCDKRKAILDKVMPV